MSVKSRLNKRTENGTVRIQGKTLHAAEIFASIVNDINKKHNSVLRDLHQLQEYYSRILLLDEPMRQTLTSCLDQALSSYGYKRSGTTWTHPFVK
jgi:3-methyladenine DNA glycosylase AlkC